MVMPLHDDAPLRYLRRPIVNWTLIAINVAVFLVVFSEVFGDPLTIIRGFAIIPRVLFDEAALAEWIVGPPPPLTLVTSLFFHSGVLHIAGNMLFLYVFGDNIEDAMGSFHYLLFYLSCGIAGGLCFVYSSPHAITPLVGASAAISGVCAAFLLLYPRSSILFLVFALLPFQVLYRLFVGRWIPMLFYAPAWMFVGAWILLQFMNALWGEQGHVAWVAHVGGIAAGLVLTPLFKRRSMRLLDMAPPEAPRSDSNPES